MRFYSGGILNAVRSTGHYQSSTAIAGTVASYVFYFVAGEVIVDRSAHRTHGLSVRCIRE